MKLERLQYQLDAVEAAIAALAHANIATTEDVSANPPLTPPAGRNRTPGIDVKMETGTGKTYVYTRLMHELHRTYGFFKFIIIVPSVAIKEGVKSAIKSDEWKRHFREEFDGQDISLGVINAGDFTAKRGRKQFPEALRSFCSGDCIGNSDSERQNKNIHCLLLNDAMLGQKSNMNADDYDTSLFDGINCPVEALRRTRPIVIIDEPHRFNKENKAWKNIEEKLKPQLFIRFGATFPEKNGTADYERGAPVYDLNSVKAFLDNLVKGVKVFTPKSQGNKPLEPETHSRFRAKKFVRGKSVTFIQVGTSREIDIHLDEPLSVLDPRFEDLRIEEIGAASATLSDDGILEMGSERVPEFYAKNYQEVLLQIALDEHFHREKENFSRENAAPNAPRIKTNSLFFIDNIASFRGVKEQSGENTTGWLRTLFEKILRAKLNTELAATTDIANGYRDYLQASLNDIPATIAGYFAEDNNKKGDDAIQAEVDDILRNKEGMLRFKNADGSWNTRRFLFSKWTLREGWDNPNVFVICKLRSSGSEISKIQEVGRGLRLPFDETGSRVSAQNSNEVFNLSYVIDPSELLFARKLLGEINADGAKLPQGKINDEILHSLTIAGYAKTPAFAKAKLLMDEIIDKHDVILEWETLNTLLPEDKKLKLLPAGKITGDGLKAAPTVKLNKAHFEKLRDLWNKLAKRYILKFEKIDAAELRQTITNIFRNAEIYTQQTIQAKIEQTTHGDGRIDLLVLNESAREFVSEKLKYGEFIKRLSVKTSLPINLLHSALVDARNGTSTPPEFFNTQTITNFIAEFERRFAELYRQRFKYVALEFQAVTSIFKADGISFVDELRQGDLGKNLSTAKIVDKKRYLYEGETVAYDSDIELQVLKTQLEPSVVVYGKLPKRCIKLPVYTGGTTSPDFVFAINKNGGDAIELHLIVETKSDNPRLSDSVAVEAQREFFKANFQGTNITWEMKTDSHAFADLLSKMTHAKPQ
jgi:type III restriction enzyme